MKAPVLLLPGPRPSRRLLAQAPQDEEKKMLMTQQD
jgi:hypothetical protein